MRPVMRPHDGANDDAHEGAQHNSAPAPARDESARTCAHTFVVCPRPNPSPNPMCVLARPKRNAATAIAAIVRTNTGAGTSEITRAGLHPHKIIIRFGVYNRERGRGN